MSATTDKAPPTVSVDAGTGEVTPGGELTLTATGEDPDGGAVTYAWRQTSGAAGTFDATDQAAVTWTAPATTGEAILEVTVTDDESATATATATVTVKAGAVDKRPPTVTATASSREASLGGSITLTASGNDPDEGAVTYTWRQTAGTAGTLSATEGAVVTWRAPATPGTAVIEVTATDDESATATDSVTLTVAQHGSNRNPSVRATCSPCEVDANGSATLRATASDPDGDILTYRWSAPAGSFEGPTDGATAVWRAPDGGRTVDVRVTVSDGAGGSASSTVTTTVRAAEPDNRDPSVAVDCEPCTVESRGEVKLRATASDPDGDPLDYRWTASRGRFAGRTHAATARWTAPAAAGSARIEVHVSGGRGGTASATVTLLVDEPDAPPNRVPAFTSTRYAVDLAESRDGRSRPVELGRVEATDPDGERVTYALSAGDTRRFRVDENYGRVHYTGPGADFESASTRHELTVVARDEGTDGREPRSR